MVVTRYTTRTLHDFLDAGSLTTHYYYYYYYYYYYNNYHHCHYYYHYYLGAGFITLLNMWIRGGAFRLGGIDTSPNPKP